jgi:glucose/arabinose dehydrogenase
MIHKTISAAVLISSFLVVAGACLQAADKIDESPLPLEPVRAFPNLEFIRPLLLTHAGDGSGRVFVCSQLGKIHVFDGADEHAGKTQAFLDLEKQVVYKDKENEEGLLGLAFHPKYKQNGQFFVYYTSTAAPHLSVISRFRVSKDDPNRADPASEEEIMRVKQPFWNHNGGTIIFGPDGYLYVALGDGGLANDPFKNGQKLSTLLGKILRIDVDRKDAGLNYAVPKDNPFVGAKDAAGNARGEIWAYGLRNVWRMAFDPATGLLWAGDVGQDTWEEIDLIVRGGNYGWNLREAKHKFGPDGADPRPDLIEPIWEYHHDVGKSITGGQVYRGKKLPQLVGSYLYADYVSGKIWGLRYDDKAKQVVANREIKGNIMPVVSFGEDEAGEAYFMTTQGWLFRFKALK